MSADAVMTCVASDGTRQTFRKGAGDAAPRPIADEELEAVADGGRYRVTFSPCGCVVTANGVDNATEAMEQADVTHTNWTGHTIDGGSVRLV